MKYNLFFICLLFSAIGFSQTTMLNERGSEKLDLRIGVGASIMGTGDMINTVFENELNYKISPHIASGIAVNYGRSDRGVSEQSSFLQGNLNLYVSPFKNDGKFDFRIGTGISYMNVTDVRESSNTIINGELDTDYVLEERNGLGFNIIIENTYALTDRLGLGIKAFTQSYPENDINSGIMLKLGVKF